MRRYELPALPYAPFALEPHIARRVVELHHGKHHAAYVVNANATMEKLVQARDREDFSSLPALERALAFNRGIL